MKAFSAISVYRGAAFALTPLAGYALAARARAGKEDPERLPERLGHAGVARPPGRLVWLHGASIGEALALVPLVERFLAQGFRALVTTGTVTAAAVLAQRLPAGALQQFAPLDLPAPVRRFVAHWRPDLALFSESEIWPNLIEELWAAHIPAVVVNARMSERSFARWMRIRASAQDVFGKISLCLAQSPEHARRFADLGAGLVIVAGNLKYDVAAPPADRAALAALSGLTGPRPVVAALSTHPGEEAMLIAAHRAVSEASPDLLTIVVPRDAARGADIAGFARASGLSVALRSRGSDPGRDCAIYVADTFGEAGLWLRLASVVVMGKTFIPGGGQNPIEAAKLGACVLHGPSTYNFSDIYGALDAAGGAECVIDANALAPSIANLLRKPGKQREMARASARVVEAMSGATEITMREIEGLLGRAPAAAAL